MSRFRLLSVAQFTLIRLKLHLIYRLLFAIVPSEVYTMSAITFDTLKVSNRPCEAGYTEQQADVFAEVQKETLSEAMETTLATNYFGAATFSCCL
jgi:hypothetical protein